MTEAPAIPKGVARAIDRYSRRLARGERILRDANGRLHWPNGRAASAKTVGRMLDAGSILQLDTDLFGDPARGQTLGVDAPP